MITPGILKVLTLNIQTKNVEMDLGENFLAIICRVYCIVMKTQISRKALIMSPRDETLLFKVNLKHRVVKVPIINLNEIWQISVRHKILKIMKLYHQTLNFLMDQ